MAGSLRWPLADQPPTSGQLALFNDVVEHHFGTGEFRGLEFLHVNAKRIINEVPSASRMPFRFTINAYRGCTHQCRYCAVGETPVLMADGRTKELRDLRVGDMIVGTTRNGHYREYVTSEVLAHWETVKPAYRIRLEDGTELITSGDHRFLSDRGWKHVIGAEQGPLQRPFLTTNNRLIGTGQFAEAPKHDDDYKRGYLCGMIRGDGTTGVRTYLRRNGTPWVHYAFRLALIDEEALDRTVRFLGDFGVEVTRFRFSPMTATRQAVNAIRTQARAAVLAVIDLLVWPPEPSDSWQKGFLAGIFDAEGSCSTGSALRIANCDREIITRVVDSLAWLGFDFVVENTGNPNGLQYVRLRGGLRERLRFFMTVDTAITRKRAVQGLKIKGKPPLGVVSIEPLGLDLPMYDITTTTGDFIANGIVSHNCFARPTHEYLGLNAGEDFDTKIVVKINAVEKLRAELRDPRWQGDTIAMGTNTDPYQRCEGKYRLTRGIIEVLGQHGNPFSILTKGTLILRDLDVLVEAAKQTDVRTSFSIGTLDPDVWRAAEPGTPHPQRRVEAIAKLNEAGIPCNVLVAPIIPGLSDSPEQLEAVTAACVKAGASVTPIVLHLRPGVREEFMPWLEQYRPELVAEYQQRYSRAYIDKGYQDKITALVHEFARANRPSQARV